MAMFCSHPKHPETKRRSAGVSQEAKLTAPRRFSATVATGLLRSVDGDPVPRPWQDEQNPAPGFRFKAWERFRRNVPERHTILWVLY